MDSGQRRTEEPESAVRKNSESAGRGGPRIAERIARLGTETAFAVSAEAAVFAAQGHHVYPFHLGDLNIPTPSNVVEASFKAIRDGKTGYCPNAGIPALRAALAADVSASHGLSYSAENVAIEMGGKPVIGKFILALMNPGDEVLYPNPGYPIYESQIEFHGGVAVPYGYLEGEHGFVIDLDALEAAITPQTRLLIVNDLQNPMAAECSAAELERLAELALRHDLTVLCDEAYFDIRYSGASASLASLPGMAERSVILYTFSKKFAMTGWRLGAAIGPREVIEVIAKLNTNDESCPNHFIQYGVLEGLTGDQSGPRQIISILARAAGRRRQDLERVTGYLLLHAERDLLPVPQRHPRHGEQGVHRCRGLPARRAPRDRCVGVFTRPFRPASARRGRAVPAVRLLGHRHRADRRGTRAPKGVSRRRTK